MRRQLSAILNQPLCIGDAQISNRLVLAPMSLLGHIAFRKIVHRFGGYGLLFSEMCNAKKVPTENKKTSPYFRWSEAERSRLVFQIYGDNKEVMAQAARRIEDEGLFGVDINFGCSVSKICNKNFGAALLKNPEISAEIVHHVKKNVSIPVFVKFRTGWKDDPSIAVDLAKRFESAGADALTFHPRIAPDRRSRPPKWSYITMIKKSVSIPVFGNGNVFTAEDCLKMINETGCDGVSVGRAAVVKPWLFIRWSKGFDPGDSIYIQTTIRMIELLQDNFSPIAALKRYKKFISYFAANFQYGHTLISLISGASNLDEARKTTLCFMSGKPEISNGLNLNFLR